jgi:hypothetical protein
VAALVDFVEVDEVGATKVLQGFIRDVDVEWAVSTALLMTTSLNAVI